MSNDISTPFTRQENKNNGRHGWVGWQSNKERQISPRNYGEFVSKRRKGKKKR